MRRRPLGNSVPVAINRYINSAYDNVLLVAENIEAVNVAAENIEFLSSYLGAYENGDVPNERPDGSPLETGDFYYSDKATYYYNADDNTWTEFNPEELLTASANAVDAAARAEEARDVAVDAEEKAASLIGGTDIGDYEDDPTFNTILDYVVFGRGTSEIALFKVEENVNLPYTVDSTNNPHPTDDDNLRAYTSTATMYTYEETTYLTDGQVVIDATSELKNYVVYLWDSASGEHDRLDVVYDYTTNNSNQIVLTDTYPVGSIVTIVFEDIGQNSDTYLKKQEAEQKYGDHNKQANRGSENSHPASAISTTSGESVQTMVEAIKGKNELTNSNFLTPSPDDITHPSSIATAYDADTQIFSGVYAGEDGCTITYVNGRVTCTLGSYEYRVPITTGLEYVPTFSSSVASYDGLPKQVGVTHTLVNDNYVVSITPEAGSVLSVKLEQGSVATGHMIDNIRRNKLNTLEYYGVSKNNTPEQNATYFVNSAKEQGAVITHESYEFDFSSIPLFDVDNEFFLFDMGMKEHVFKNFNGIRCTEAKALKVNCNLDVNNTNLIKFLKMEKVEVMYSDFMYVKNVKMDTDLDCWFIEVNTNNDVEMTSGFGVCKFNNWIAKVTDGVSPFGSAMTLFGNANAASGFSETHTWNFGSLSINEFYTIQSSDDSIVDGESDALRLFSNRAIVNIGSCNTKNFAKRFVKSQNVCHLTIDSFGTHLDNRFQGSGNHIATIDMQPVSQTEPSTCVINNIDLDYSLASSSPLLFSCGGDLEHSLIINGGNYKNYTIFSSTAPVNISLNNMTGDRTAINCVLSDSVKLNNYKDSDLISTRCNLIKFEKSNISTKRTPTSNSLVTNAVLVDTVIDDWDSGDKLGTVRRISGLELNITKGTSNGRPIYPVSGKYYYENIEVNNTSGVTIELIYTNTGSGDIIVRTARLGSDVNLAFLSAGSWDVTLDDCDNEVVSGSGVTSKVKASYVSF